VIERKTCNVCELEKPVSSFYKSKQTPDGFVYSCKECWSLKAKHKRNQAREITLENISPDARFLDFAELVKVERTKLGWTQEYLGTKLGIGSAQIRLWEKSKCLPRQTLLKKVCELFGVDVPLSVQGGDGGRLPLAVKHCVQCGKKYPQYKAHVRHCSRDCSDLTFGEKQQGFANHIWKGGRCSAGMGAFWVKIPGHPAATKGGYVLEHRYLMEQAIGRFLERHEIVHHRTGDRGDNRIKPGHESGLVCGTDCCSLELWKVKTKDPPGVRASDYHCPGCRCHESTILESCN
jgi:transcriptional regulator with XRE-family HTH domain